MKLVLASNSPRRREILGGLGYEFDVFAAPFDESAVSLADPVEGVQKLALGKAEASAKAAEQSGEDTLFLGSDTVVVLDGAAMGKPADEEDAKRMLRTLSGRTHQVYTGVAAVVRDGTTGELTSETFASCTDVTFYELSEAEINTYVTTKEPMDKAGAYGIQGKGCVLVSGINGDYLTVVGLPAAETYRLLQRHGVLPT